jgi:enamine deaminase RidA (YjgF/YER057c/UK114 family)
MSRFEEFARAHGEAFRGIDPAATCVQVSSLVGPEYLVEIEAGAIIASAPEERPTKSGAMPVVCVW